MPRSGDNLEKNFYIEEKMRFLSQFTRKHAVIYLFKEGTDVGLRQNLPKIENLGRAKQKKKNIFS